MARKQLGATPSAGTDAATKDYVDSGAASLSNKTLVAPKFADLDFIADANGNELLVLDTVASAVNEVKLANAATGNAPKLSAQGGDTDVSLHIREKGAGTVQTGRPVAFYMTSTLSVTNGSAPDMTGTEVMDYGGNNLNAGTGVFTAPYTGVYHFDLNAGFTDTTNTSPTAARFDLNLLVNGATVGHSHSSVINTNADPAAQVSITMPLTAGDTVKGQISNNTGGTESLVTSSFSGFLVGRTD